MKDRVAAAVSGLIFLGCAAGCFIAGAFSPEMSGYDWDRVLEGALLMWLPGAVSLAVFVIKVRAIVRRERFFRMLDELAFRAQLREAEEHEEDTADGRG